MPDYHFDEERHIYYMEGQIVPSVTAVLPYPEYKNCDYQRTRGTYVHKMIELYLAGDLDESSLDPVLVPYLEAYKASEAMNLQGVIDLKSGSPTPATPLQIAAYVLLANEGVKQCGRRPDIIEIEEPLFHPVYKFAGTPDLIITDKYPVISGAALYLRDNGKPKFEDHSKDLRHNRQVFLSFLITYQWKKEKGLL